MYAGSVSCPAGLRTESAGTGCASFVKTRRPVVVSVYSESTLRTLSAPPYWGAKAPALGGQRGSDGLRLLYFPHAPLALRPVDNEGVGISLEAPEQGSWLQLDILGGHNGGSVRRGIVCALHTW